MHYNDVYFDLVYLMYSKFLWCTHQIQHRIEAYGSSCEIFSQAYCEVWPQRHHGQTANTMWPCTLFLCCCIHTDKKTLELIRFYFGQYHDLITKGFSCSSYYLLTKRGCTRLINIKLLFMFIINMHCKPYCLEKFTILVSILCKACNEQLILFEARYNDE